MYYRRQVSWVAKVTLKKYSIVNMKSINSCIFQYKKQIRQNNRTYPES